MTKAEALYKFFSQFGIPGYAAQTVPDDAQLPYLTYTPIFGTLNVPVSSTVNVWYRTYSEKEVYDKMEEIVRHIKNAPIYAYDGGAMLFTVADGYGQDIPQEINPALKGKTMNIDIEFLTI